MGTRIIRATGKDLLPKAQSWLGKRVQAVTWEGKAYAGDLKTVSDNELSVVDPNAVWYNQKRHTHTLSLEGIRELILDEKSSW